MPIPPARNSASPSTVLHYTVGGGARLMPIITRVANNNIPNTQMSTMGADAQPFSMIAKKDGTAFAIVTFPNLYKRNTQTNPISSLTNQQPVPLTVQPSDHLLLMVHTQGAISPDGVVISVVGQAVTTSGVVATGPFLGAENFATFQAVVSARNARPGGNVAGIVAATLFLAIGSA